MIIDENGNRIPALPLTVAPNTTLSRELLLTCFDGFELSAAFDAESGDDPAVRVWAKANIGDAFQNLHTSPLDLSPYDGMTKTIYFEYRAGIGAIKRDAIILLSVAMPG